MTKTKPYFSRKIPNYCKLFDKIFKEVSGNIQLYMANFTERAVIDPKIWLAQADLQNHYSSEAAFLGNFVKQSQKLYFEFRKYRSPINISQIRNELSDYLPVFDKRFMAKVGLAIPLAFAVYGFSLVSAAFIQETILNQNKHKIKTQALLLNGITLPFRLH